MTPPIGVLTEFMRERRKWGGSGAVRARRRDGGQLVRPVPESRTVGRPPCAVGAKAERPDR